MLPNLLVPGFPKCGTTSIHQILTEAGVRSTSVKETGFLLRRDFDRHAFEAAYARSFGNTRKAVENLYLLDATPWCIYDADVPARWTSLSSPKSIILVRENMSRMRSMFLDQRRGGHEKRTFEAAVQHNLRSSGGMITEFSRNVPRHYVQTSLYWPYVDRWLASDLGADTRLIALESLHNSPENVLGQLGNWLDLRIEPASGPANAGADGQYSFAPALLKAVNSKIGPLVPTRLRPLALSIYQPLAERLGRFKFGSPAPDVELNLSEQTIAQLTDLFMTDRQGLRTMPRQAWLGAPPSWIEE